MSDIKALRYGMGADILEMMAANDDLPLPNIRRLAKVMMEYFHREGMTEVLPPKSKWRPTADYWILHLDDVRAWLRKRGEYFEYVRPQGEFKGDWQFTTKADYIAVLTRESADVRSRENTYNDRLEDGKQKWQIDLPAARPLPQLN